MLKSSVQWTIIANAVKKDECDILEYHHPIGM